MIVLYNAATIVLVLCIPLFVGTILYDAFKHTKHVRLRHVESIVLVTALLIHFFAFILLFGFIIGLLLLIGFMARPSLTVYCLSRIFHSRWMLLLSSRTHLDYFEIDSDSDW